MLKLTGIIFVIIYQMNCIVIKECYKLNNTRVIDYRILKRFADVSVPTLEGKHKSENGKIVVIGGSIEHTGAPYFTAISSLRMGADVLLVITTEDAAPVIRTYSPILVVYPYLDQKYMQNINTILTKVQLVILGPGLGEQNNTIRLTTEIIKSCKALQIPLIIDADGLDVVAKNPSVIKNYSRPGVILTPNTREMNRLLNSIGANTTKELIDYYGPYVSILAKGGNDTFTSHFWNYNWSFSMGGSARRGGCQGDILSGITGTFFNWALKARLCENEKSDNIAASVASFVASKLTRSCNEKAYRDLGRSMLALDMLDYIHSAFNDFFEHENNESSSMFINTYNICQGRSGLRDYRDFSRWAGRNEKIRFFHSAPAA